MDKAELFVALASQIWFINQSPQRVNNSLSLITTMVSTTLSTLTILSAAATVVSQMDAYGYIISPKAQGNGIEHPGNFVIEYSPPWTGDWKGPKTSATAAKEKDFSTCARTSRTRASCATSRT